MMGSKLDKVAKLVEKNGLSGLIKLAGDNDKTVKLAAIAGLGKINKDDGFNFMIPLLSDSDSDIRCAAALALGEMKNDHASAHLRYCLEREKDPAVLAALKTAISGLGGSQ